MYNCWTEVIETKANFGKIIGEALTKKYKGKDCNKIKSEDIERDGEYALRTLLAMGELSDDFFYGKMRILIDSPDHIKIKGFEVTVF